MYTTFLYNAANIARLSSLLIHKRQTSNNRFRFSGCNCTLIKKMQDIFREIYVTQRHILYAPDTDQLTIETLL